MPEILVFIIVAVIIVSIIKAIPYLIAAIQEFIRNSK